MSIHEVNITTEDTEAHGRIRMPFGADGDEATNDVVAAYTWDPYPAWSLGASYSDGTDRNEVGDVPLAREWFDRIDESRRLGVYSFALPLDSMSGPHARYLDREMLSFSTYGYLGLNGHPRIQKAVHSAIDRYGTTTGGARLLTGTSALHRDGESVVAEWLGTQDAAIFNSGFDANVSAITSLVGPRDTAVVDQLAHRSLIDGCKLSGARTRRFRHNDVEDLRRVAKAAVSDGGRVLVIVDGVYSMHGDQAPLAEIASLRSDLGFFLLVDESHGLGVLGSQGRGTAWEQGVPVHEIDVITGSLGKAIPSVGGVVAGSRQLITYLRHASPHFMFSSAIAPGNVAAISETINILREEPRHQNSLRVNSALLRKVVEVASKRPSFSSTPIVPLVLGNSIRAYTWSRILLSQGIYVSPIPSPAVAKGDERLRLCATAGHGPDDFDKLAFALKLCAELEQDPRNYQAYVSRFEPIPAEAEGTLYSARCGISRG